MNPRPIVFGVIDRIDRLNHIAGIDISSCDTVVLLAQDFVQLVHIVEYFALLEDVFELAQAERRIVDGQIVALCRLFDNRLAAGVIHATAAFDYRPPTIGAFVGGEGEGAIDEGDPPGLHVAHVAHGEFRDDLDVVFEFRDRKSVV